MFLQKNGYGIIMAKARGIDTTADPKDVYKKVIADLKEFEILETVSLRPYEKDHMAVIIKNI